MTSINFWPILVAAVVAFVIGALWYSPILFGDQWLALKGMSKKDITADMKKGMWKFYIIQFIATIVTFIVLGFLVASIGTRSTGEGMFLAFIIWIGFSLTSAVGDVLWNKTPLKLAMLTEAATLVSWLVGGAIIGAWR